VVLYREKCPSHFLGSFSKTRFEKKSFLLKEIEGTVKEIKAVYQHTEDNTSTLV